MNPIIIPIVGMLIPIVIVPTALWFKHARFLREKKHAERMKALELGQTLPGDESWSLAPVGVMIGAGVPIAVMFIAFIAAPQAGDSDSIWKAATMIGVAAVICGTVLSGLHFSNRNQSAMTSSLEKPAFDHEAFEPMDHRA